MSPEMFKVMLEANLDLLSDVSREQRRHLLERMAELYCLRCARERSAGHFPCACESAS